MVSADVEGAFDYIEHVESALLQKGVILNRSALFCANAVISRVAINCPQ